MLTRLFRAFAAYDDLGINALNSTRSNGYKIELFLQKLGIFEKLGKQLYALLF